MLFAVSVPRVCVSAAVTMNASCSVYVPVVSKVIVPPNVFVLDVIVCDPRPRKISAPAPERVMPDDSVRLP